MWRRVVEVVRHEVVGWGVVGQEVGLGGSLGVVCAVLSTVLVVVWTRV